jgi:hypothetical protein
MTIFFGGGPEGTTTFGAVEASGSGGGAECCFAVLAPGESDASVEVPPPPQPRTATDATRHPISWTDLI